MDTHPWVLRPCPNDQKAIILDRKRPGPSLHVPLGLPLQTRLNHLEGIPCTAAICCRAPDMPDLKRYSESMEGLGHIQLVLTLGFSRGLVHLFLPSAVTLQDAPYLSREEYRHTPPCSCIRFLKHTPLYIFHLPSGHRMAVPPLRRIRRTPLCSRIRISQRPSSGLTTIAAMQDTSTKR